MDLKLLADILEAGMIVGFGISWPLSVYKAFKSKTAKGMSLLFLLFIECGYICGITSKIINPEFDWSTRWWIFCFYVLNLTMVTINIVLYFINKNRDKKSLISEENKELA